MTPTPNPVTWTMEDLYNLLMRGVEPDLCTGTLPLLELMYAGESKEERAERMQWYAEAFSRFLERYAKFNGAIHGEFQKIQTSLRSVAEGKDSATDAQATAMLEKFFDASDAA